MFWFLSLGFGICCLGIGVRRLGFRFFGFWPGILSSEIWVWNFVIWLFGFWILSCDL